MGMPAPYPQPAPLPTGPTVVLSQRGRPKHRRIPQSATRANILLTHLPIWQSVGNDARSLLLLLLACIRGHTAQPLWYSSWHPKDSSAHHVYAIKDGLHRNTMQQQSSETAAKDSPPRADTLANACQPSRFGADPLAKCSRRRGWTLT